MVHAVFIFCVYYFGQYFVIPSPKNVVVVSFTTKRCSDAEGCWFLVPFFFDLMLLLLASCVVCVFFLEVINVCIATATTTTTTIGTQQKQQQSYVCTWKKEKKILIKNSKSKEVFSPFSATTTVIQPANNNPLVIKCCSMCVCVCFYFNSVQLCSRNAKNCSIIWKLYATECIKNQINKYVLHTSLKSGEKKFKKKLIS